MRLATLLFLTVLALTGCQATSRRIVEHQGEFSRLDAATQKLIRHGEIRPGFSMMMVYMARGNPSEVLADSVGRAVWLYHVEPLTGPNESVSNGFRRRYVYNPSKQSYDVVVELIDPKSFPQLVPHTFRLTFQDGRLLTIERVNRR